MKMNRGILLVIGLMLSQAYVGQAMAMNGTRTESDAMCPLCDSEMQSNTKHTTTCNHTTCLECFVKWRYQDQHMGCPFCRKNRETDYAVEQPANRFMELVIKHFRKEGKPLGLELAEAVKFNDQKLFTRVKKDLELLGSYPDSQISDMAHKVITDSLAYRDQGLGLSVQLLVNEAGNRAYREALKQIRVN